MIMYDGDFTFDETERVQVAINAYDAGDSDGSALERLIECWATE
jgi:hypothetical protein